MPVQSPGPRCQSCPKRGGTLAEACQAASCPNTPSRLIEKTTSMQQPAAKCVFMNMVVQRVMLDVGRCCCTVLLLQSMQDMAETTSMSTHVWLLTLPRQNFSLRQEEAAMYLWCLLSRMPAGSSSAPLHKRRCCAAP